MTNSESLRKILLESGKMWKSPKFWITLPLESPLACLGQLYSKYFNFINDLWTMNGFQQKLAAKFLCKNNFVTLEWSVAQETLCQKIYLCCTPFNDNFKLSCNNLSSSVYLEGNNEVLLTIVPGEPK